ncbi:MAG TPA: hypothetical protein VNP98_17300 [Chthoniobacterales bacterium]|nr:hypothetical protein [Chthoniobacterales bacterium]
MKKLFICLILASGAAALRVEFQWEKNARREWREYATAVHAQAADLKALGL